MHNSFMVRNESEKVPEAEVMQMPSPRKSEGGMSPSTAEVIESKAFVHVMTIIADECAMAALRMAMGFSVARKVVLESGIEDEEEVMSAVMTMYEHGEIFH